MNELVVPILSGVAGSFITVIAKQGTEWLIELVASQSEAVQKKSLMNTQNFLERLAKRVESLEKELPPDRKEIFVEALGHPGSSLLMRKAFVTAAATENDDRHEILSELIAQRLSAGAEDMIALVGSASCDVVSALSSRQIRLLGVMASLLFLKPIETPRHVDQETYDADLIAYLKPLVKLSDGLEKVTPLDINHLAGLSCVVLLNHERNLGVVIASKFGQRSMYPTMEKVKCELWWPNIKHVWDLGIRFLSLTSTGSLIGTLYYDSETKTRSRLDWE